jgi:hypothetical protein
MYIMQRNAIYVVNTSLKHYSYCVFGIYRDCCHDLEFPRSLHLYLARFRDSASRTVWQCYVLFLSARVD